jgi:hypothetical protein
VCTKPQFVISGLIKIPLRDVHIPRLRSSAAVAWTAVIILSSSLIVCSRHSVCFLDIRSCSRTTGSKADMAPR